MSKEITRRQAIKTMVVAGTAAAVTGSLLDSCKPKTQETKTAQPKGPAPEGSKVFTRTWEQLGGDTVSVLGMGCMRFPRSSGSGRNAPIDQEQVNAMFDYAIAHGINYFDTAPAYGGSEVATGIALKRHPRESYYIATKLSNHGERNPTAESAQAMFERSLENLQTDYVDYMLLHNLGSYDQFLHRFIDNGALNYLIEQRNSGKIRHLGFSYHGDNENFRRIIDSNFYNWEFVQIQMNYLDWKSMNGSKTTDAKTLYTILAERNIPATVMEPIRGGALANVSDAMKGKLAEIRSDLSPAGMALAYVGSYPNILSCLSGMSNMEQLVENVATFTDFKEFSEAENAAILKLADLYNASKHIPCTTCRYCMPCPSGVDIPGNFLVYNTTSDELNLPDPEGEHDKDYNRRRRIFLNRYNKELEKNAKADACVQCNICVPKCPQHINIPDQMIMIRDLAKALK